MHSEAHGSVGVIPMADFGEVIDRLLKRRSELVTQLERVDRAIRALKDAADLVGEDAVANIAVLAPQAFGVPTEEPQETRERNIIPPADIARYAREIILESGRPMKRGRLVRALEARGVPLAGTDKNKNRGTILWRHRDQFVNLPNLGYWPRDVRLPDIYDPETYKGD